MNAEELILKYNLMTSDPTNYLGFLDIEVSKLSEINVKFYYLFTFIFIRRTRYTN
jgi:hypothetical protein